MRSILVTATDTGVGKTRACGALARLLAANGATVQLVKLVETGRVEGENGDAHAAQCLAGNDRVTAQTGLSFPRALAPLAAAKEAGAHCSLDQLIAIYDQLPESDWCILEGAGGIAVPLDASGRDWADFAEESEIDEIILVVPNRLGAINQARLASCYAAQRGLRVRIWLNASAPVEPAVARSNRAGLAAAGLIVFATQGFDALLPDDAPAVLAQLQEARALPGPPSEVRGFPRRRAETLLAEREVQGLRRRLTLFTSSPATLNLADNDYLELARDPALQEAVAAAAREHGTSASASPLITGWQQPQAALLAALGRWHGYDHGLLWSSGYAANVAVLGTLLEKGDLALVDRLIHHSMIAGLRRSGARLKRYPHLDLDRLEVELDAASGRTTAVITESVFSMDGDYPDLVRMAALKRKHGFLWVVDEAHALGWYGPSGAGLVAAASVQAEVDVLIGTLGKTLASGGAYSLFRDEAVRELLLNQAGEFIYSTGLSPVSAAAATAAIARVGQLAVAQGAWQATSQVFRTRLRASGWDAPDGTSPVIPVRIGEAQATVDLARALRADGIVVGAVRPPTVPEGTSRLRFSLKRSLTESEMERVLAVMETWRRRR